MTDGSDLMEAGLAAVRVEAERDALDRIAAGADEAARHALAQFGEDEWLDVDFAEALLVASRTLRQAGLRPTPAVVEAMERCTDAHLAWADVWANPVPERAPETDPVSEQVDDVGSEQPIRIQVGLGDLIKGALKVGRT